MNRSEEGSAEPWPCVVIELSAVYTTRIVLDVPSDIASVMEALRGGLNGVEVVMFQRMDLLDTTVAYYTPQSGSVQHGANGHERKGTEAYGEEKEGKKNGGRHRHKERSKVTGKTVGMEKETKFEKKKMRRKHRKRDKKKQREK